MSATARREPMPGRSSSPAASTVRTVSYRCGPRSLKTTTRRCGMSTTQKVDAPHSAYAAAFSTRSRVRLVCATSTISTQIGGRQPLINPSGDRKSGDAVVILPQRKRRLDPDLVIRPGVMQAHQTVDAPHDQDMQQAFGAHRDEHSVDQLHAFPRIEDSGVRHPQRLRETELSDLTRHRAFDLQSRHAHTVLPSYVRLTHPARGMRPFSRTSSDPCAGSGCVYLPHPACGRALRSAMSDPCLPETQSQTLSSPPPTGVKPVCRTFAARRWCWCSCATSAESRAMSTSWRSLHSVTPWPAV